MIPSRVLHCINAIPCLDLICLAQRPLTGLQFSKKINKGNSTTGFRAKILLISTKPPTQQLPNMLPFACLVKIGTASKLLGLFKEERDPVDIIIEHLGIRDPLGSKPFWDHGFGSEIVCFETIGLAGATFALTLWVGLSIS
jgi:hypothetical protein